MRAIGLFTAAAPITQLALLALFVPVPVAARAQADSDALNLQQAAVACAVSPRLEVPRIGGLRVVGGQQTEARSLFGPRDLLVIDGGTNAGLLLGQRFYLRRPVTLGEPSKTRPRAVHTSGWIRIVALNDATAIASIDAACGDILQGDYLDAFTPPAVPDGIDRTDVGGEPDFSALGRVLFGGDEARTGAAGDFMLIDRGANAGVASGARMAIYRDHRTAGVPLASVGEGIVIAAAPETALMRITLARDAVETGDLVAPRK